MKYCEKCGTPSPDSSAFCSACGKAFSAASVIPDTTAAGTTAPDTFAKPYVARPAEKEPFAVHFRRAWRELAASPLALITIISYCVVQFFGFLETSNAFEELGGILRYVLGSSELLRSGRSILTIYQLIIYIPAILTAIGLWMIYADARDLSNRPIKVSGLSLLRGVMIANIIVFYILLAIILLSACSALEGSDLVGTVVFVLLITGVVSAFIYRLMLNLLNAIIDSAQYCTVQTDCVTATAVLLFISGGLLTLGMLITDLNLTQAISCAMPFLFGAMLLKYKTMMTELYYAQSENKSTTDWLSSYNYTQANTERQPQQVQQEQKAKMATVVVDRSGESMTCPACGKVQNSKRTRCFECGVLFAEKQADFNPFSDNVDA